MQKREAKMFAFDGRKQSKARLYNPVGCTLSYLEEASGVNRMFLLSAMDCCCFYFLDGFV